MKAIIISTSKFGNAVSDYYKELGRVFEEKNYKVIFIFDQQVSTIESNSINTFFYTWPSKRPTNFKDFIFLSKLIYKYKPVLCISNFGSTNVMSIVSWVFGVKNRINYIHTTTKAIENDFDNHFKLNLLKFRKKQIFKLNTHFFTNSKGTKENSIKSFNITRDKIYVFPLLIKKSKQIYLKKIKRNHSLIIVGGLTPNKGHEQLIHQFKDCLKKYPDLKLKIIGDGYLKERLEEIVNHLELTENILFEGKVSNKFIGMFFSRSLISISSSFDEAYGLVNIEALREGTPIICTKTAGSKDILVENVNGKYFNLLKKKSLCDAIDNVLLNWENYSINSVNYFNEKYYLENNIENHFNEIEKIIK